MKDRGELRRLVLMRERHARAHAAKPKPSKYRAVRTELDGMKFDSKGEAGRYAELKLLERAGEISGLKRQVEFQLGTSCLYRADFVYFDKDGSYIVEDWKGAPRTEAYRIKKKLMKEHYGIDIVETGPPRRRAQPRTKRRA